MSSFRGESHSVSHIFRLEGFTGPSLVRASSSDHEKEDILFRIVHRTHWATGSSAPVLVVAPVVAAPVVYTLI